MADRSSPEWCESIMLGVDTFLEPKTRQMASPIQYVTKDAKLPATLLVHGDVDHWVPFDQSVLLYEKMCETGHYAELIRVRKAAHNDRMWSKPVVNAVIEFLRANL